MRPVSIVVGLAAEDKIRYKIRLSVGSHTAAKPVAQPMAKPAWHGPGPKARRGPRMEVLQLEAHLPSALAAQYAPADLCLRLHPEKHMRGELLEKYAALFEGPPPLWLCAAIREQCRCCSHLHLGEGPDCDAAALIAEQLLRENGVDAGDPCGCRVPECFSRLQVEVAASLNLPPPGYFPSPSIEGWCRVTCGEALLDRIDKVAREHRLLLLAAAYQANYYERIFATLVLQYPCVEFATVKLEGGGGPQTLFGDIDGTPLWYRRARALRNQMAVNSFCCRACRSTLELWTRNPERRRPCVDRVFGSWQQFASDA